MVDKEVKRTVSNLAELYGVEKRPAEAHTAYLNRLVLRLFEEIKRYQEQNNGLRQQLNQSVEESAQYKELLTQIEFEQKAHEQTKKELAKLKEQTAAAAIETEPEPTRKPTTEPEQEPQPETEPPKLRVKPLKQGRPMALSDPDEIERVRELRRQGVSIRTLTEDLKAAGYQISRESVRRLVNGITPKKGSDND